jgi:hypothetical protein
MNFFHNGSNGMQSGAYQQFRSCHQVQTRSDYLLETVAALTIFLCPSGLDELLLSPQGGWEGRKGLNHHQ